MYRILTALRHALAFRVSAFWPGRFPGLHRRAKAWNPQDKEPRVSLQHCSAAADRCTEDYPNASQERDGFLLQDETGMQVMLLS